MIRIMLKTVVLSALLVTAAPAQVRAPEKGSEERAAILNALRGPVERELKQKIIFNVENFRVSGTWAFLGGEPQNPSGGEPDYSKTPFQEAKDDGVFDNNFFALLRKSGGKWRVIEYAIGCTDVCYSDWWRRYKAPKAVFPYTE